MRYLPLALLIALAGCSTTQTSAPLPGIKVVTQRIEVPVSMPCVKTSDLAPEPEKVAGKLTGDARRDLDTVAASATRLRAWGQSLRAVLIGCAKP